MDIQAILNLVSTYWPVLAGIIALAAAIAAITPSKSDDRLVQLVLDIVNKLGLNIGKAKNADDAVPPPPA